MVNGRRGAGSRPPADGISAVFQFVEAASFGTRTSRIGGAGGVLGTSNFPARYVSTAWDNEEFLPAVDPDNSVWDAAAFAGGGTHSAHVEVNQDLTRAVNSARPQTSTASDWTCRIDANASTCC